MRITDSKYWQTIKKMIPQPLFEWFLNEYYKKRTRSYLGNNHTCNVCLTELTSYVDSSCPRCAAKTRHRAVYIFLKKKTNFFTDNLKFLHFAPEFGLTKVFKKQKNIDYLSADYNSPRAMKKVNMMDIPFEDNHFDAMLSIDVLDDVPNDKLAIKELYRTMKPGGWSIHLSPIDFKLEKTYEDATITSPEDRLKHFRAYANWRVYGSDYHQRFEEAGFESKIYNAEDFCTEEELKNLQIRRHFKIYFFRKLNIWLIGSFIYLKKIIEPAETIIEPWAAIL